MIIDGFLTQTECEKMIGLIDDKMKNEQYEKRTIFDNGEQKIFELATFDSKDVEAIKDRIVRKVMEIYNDDGLYVESSYMKGRVPGPGPAHPIHVDSMEIDEKTGEITDWLSHSVLVYLNESDGGDLFFETKNGTEYIKPAPGRFVSFTSGPENPHGVTHINSGTRYAILMWFTRDKRKAER